MKTKRELFEKFEAIVNESIAKESKKELKKLVSK